MTKMDCAALREAVETWPELDRLRQLREAITLWPYLEHDGLCNVTPPLFGLCACGADDANAARLHARRLVGLEVEP